MALLDDEKTQIFICNVLMLKIVCYDLIGRLNTVNRSEIYILL